MYVCVFDGRGALCLSLRLTTGLLCEERDWKVIMDVHVERHTHTHKLVSVFFLLCPVDHTYVQQWLPAVFSPS